MGALLAAESPQRETFPETIGASVLALALVWAAHAYSAVIAHRLRTPVPPLQPPLETRSADPTRDAVDIETGTLRVQEGRAADELATEVIASRSPLAARELRMVLRHEFAVLKGGVIPLLALLLCWAAGASLNTAITATLWTCAGTLVAAELLAGLRASVGPLALAVQVAAGASLGVAVILLKVVLR